MELKLIKEDGQICLEIFDNGKGFNQAGVDDKGRLGIQGMQERAAEVGAEFSIASQSAAGTKIRVILKD